MLNSRFSILVTDAQILANRHNPPESPVCPYFSCRLSVILQNKANFQKTKMNLKPCPERRYEKYHPSRLCKNKPNQTQFSVVAGFGALGLVLGICLVFWIWCLGFYYLVTAPPSHGPRVTRHDFTKQTQFAKMQNEPNPMSRKDL